MSDRLIKILSDLRNDLTEAEREESDKLAAKLAGGRFERTTKAREKLRRAILQTPRAVEQSRAILAEENPDALWPDGFDAAFIGIARRCGQPMLAAFSMKKALDVLVERDGMTYEEAAEFFEFNVVGAWMGPGTPIWVDDTDEGA